MEYVRSIFVDVDAFHVLAIDVASQLMPLVYDQASLAAHVRKMCECSAEKTRAND